MTGMWAANSNKKMYPRLLPATRGQKPPAYTAKAQYADAFNSYLKCIQFLISILPQWYSSKRGMYDCRYERRQPPRPTLPF